MAVEVLSPAVIGGRGSRIGVPSGDLDITRGHAGIERRHDEGGSQHVGVDNSKSRPLADGAHPAVRRSPVESCAVVPAQDRTLAAFAEGQSAVGGRALRGASAEWNSKIEILPMYRDYSRILRDRGLEGATPSEYRPAF